MPMTCPACGEFEVYLSEHPITKGNCIYCIMCDWSSYEIPRFMIERFLSQAERAIEQLEGSSSEGGPGTVSEAELVDQIVEHLKKTIAVAQGLKKEVPLDGALWEGLCEIQDHAQEAWSRVIPFRC